MTENLEIKRVSPREAVLDPTGNPWYSQNTMVNMRLQVVIQSHVRLVGAAEERYKPVS